MGRKKCKYVERRKSLRSCLEKKEAFGQKKKRAEYTEIRKKAEGHSDFCT